MSRRAKRPLDAAASDAANHAFYAANPDMAPDGQRIPIDPSSSEHSSHRKEWMDHYVAAGGPLEGDDVDKSKPGDPAPPCPHEWIKFQFLSQEGNYPLAQIKAVVTDPNQNKSEHTTDKQGQIVIEPAVPGAYGITCPLADISINKCFHLTTVASASIPVTASQAPPPAEDPAHVKDAARTGDPAATDPNDRRASVYPWTPVAFAEVETRQVSDGDDLVTLGQVVDLSWDELASFNFGTDEPDEVNGQLRDLVGCTQPDRRGNYSFHASDDPGLMFLPKPFNAGNLPTLSVHIFRGEPVERPMKLELQTVDALGYRLGDISLKLVQLDGGEIEVKTNAEGYWSETHVLAGPVDVYHLDGKRAQFYAEKYRGGDLIETSDEEFNQPEHARLDPLLVRRAISTILVHGAASNSTLERRDTLRRRYGRNEADRKAAVTVGGVPSDTDSESGAGGAGAGAEKVHQPVMRYMNVGHDNLFTTALDTSGDTEDHGVFLRNLHTWLHDRHPTTIDASRGYYVMLIDGRSMKVLEPTGGGKFTERGQFKLRLLHDLYKGLISDSDGKPLIGKDGQPVIGGNPYGAYAAFETEGVDYPVYHDLETRTSIHQAFFRIFFEEEIDGDEAREDFAQLRHSLSPRVGVLYLFPEEPADLIVATLRGASGLLENYPENSGLRARAHQRNLSVRRAVSLAYAVVLNYYIRQVEDTKTARELHDLGPPPEPFHFPTPAGIGESEEEDLQGARGDSAFKAWMAVSEQLADIGNRHTAGSFYLRAKFEVSNDVNSSVGGGSTKISYKLDVGSDGVMTGSEKSVELAVGSDEVPLPMKNAKGTAKVKTEINPETGETKETIELGFSRGKNKYGIELSSDGNVKFNGPNNSYSEWNNRTAEGGFGLCLGLQDILKPPKSPVTDELGVMQLAKIPNAKFCIGIHFTLIREDQLLSYIVRAPGFFERRLIEDLLRLNWQSLTGFERMQLRVIGWGDQGWDRRKKEDFPDATGLDYSQLKPADKIAAVKLGFTQLTWKSTWLGENVKAQIRAKTRTSGR